MPLVRGTHECPICKHEFDWHYIIREKLHKEEIAAITIPDHSCKVDLLNRVGETTYTFKGYCPLCSREIYFDAEVETKILYI